MKTEILKIKKLYLVKFKKLKIIKIYSAKLTVAKFKIK